MVKKILAGLSIIGFGVFSGVFVTNAITCTNTFPTSLNGYVAGNCIPSAWSNALEDKIGITGSAATSSLDYQINNIFTSYGSEQVASSAVAWINYGTASSPSSTWLKPGNNLSELTNTSTARTNLGLGTAATLASSTWLKVSNNLSDLSNTSTARTNIGYTAGTNINLTAGGVFSITGQIPVANGGTATSTAPTDGQYLGANGGTPTYKNFVAGNNITITSSTTSTIIAATTNNSAAGSDQQIQYNNGGAFGATSTFTFTSSTHTFGLTATSSNVIIGPSTQFSTIPVLSTYLSSTSVQTYTVPTGASSIIINEVGSTAQCGVWFSATSTFSSSSVLMFVGGGGGPGTRQGNGTAGDGAVATGTLAVTPGTTYKLMVCNTVVDGALGGTGGGNSDSGAGGGGGGNGGAGGSGFDGGSNGNSTTAYGIGTPGTAGTNANSYQDGNGGKGGYYATSTITSFSASTSTAMGTASLNITALVPVLMNQSTTLAIGGIITTGGATPILSSCGTNPSITGNNTAGVITIGSSPGSTCTLNFATSTPYSNPAYANAPIPEPAGNNALSSVSTSSVVWNVNTASSSGKIYYQILGY